MSEKKTGGRLAFFYRLAFPLRIFLLLLLMSSLLVAALGQYLSASFEDYLTRQVRDMAMNQAKTYCGQRQRRGGGEKAGIPPVCRR